MSVLEKCEIYDDALYKMNQLRDRNFKWKGQQYGIASIINSRIYNFNENVQLYEGSVCLTNYAIDAHYYEYASFTNHWFVSNTTTD